MSYIATQKDINKVERISKSKNKTKNIDFPEKYIQDIADAYVKYNLTDKELESLIIRVRENYINALVEANEPIGPVASQAISEPATQMTMRTFHYAGVAELNVTLGLPRLLELLNASSVIFTPSMNIYFEDGDITKEEVEKFANKITETIVNDVIIDNDVVTDFQSNSISAKFDFNKIKAKSLKIEEIVDIVKKVFPTGEFSILRESDNDEEDIEKTTFKSLDELKMVLAEESLDDSFDDSLEGSLDNLSDNSSTNKNKNAKNKNAKTSISQNPIQSVEFTYKSKKNSIRELRNDDDKFRNISIGGIDNIRRVIIRKTEQEWFLQTDGSNLKDILNEDIVDNVRTTSNHIHEIHNVLGIEALREKIFNEFRRVLDDQGLDVDIRHIMLVADYMTYTGKLRHFFGRSRESIMYNYDSVFARAAYERIDDRHNYRSIYAGALIGEVDEFHGPLERSMIGQPIHLGTGSVDVMMKANKRKGGR
ncbi:MAG: hypothetical protein LBM96_07990 [Methanobrevibacter sp.]|jgi:DNA-directed RNA polymerase subunit A"|nr:hypothetical protein [Candidatus Methanoflexus mossambicus]